MTPPEIRYSTRVIELFRTLPRAGALPAARGSIAVGEVVALDRGAWVRFEARVANGLIVDCRFQAWGCPHTLAAAALAAERLAGRRGGEGVDCEAASLARELDAPAGKMGRLLAVADAAKALLAEAAQVQ